MPISRRSTSILSILEFCDCDGHEWFGHDLEKYRRDQSLASLIVVILVMATMQAPAPADRAEYGLEDFFESGLDLGIVGCHGSILRGQQCQEAWRRELLPRTTRFPRPLAVLRSPVEPRNRQSPHPIPPHPFQAAGARSAP